MSKSIKETPLMKQHNDIKAKYPDAVLLFRVGDFYETFGPDAVIASRVLGITLTKRANGAASSIELAGFPYHALDTYLHKLVKAGYRVAICDQLEDPKATKGIVKRGVTELVTPGVALNDKLLDFQQNNFIAALHIHNNHYGVAFVDISTGSVFVGEGSKDYAFKLLQSFEPSEVLLSKTQQKSFVTETAKQYFTYAQDEWIYNFDYAYELIIRQFGVLSLKGFGIEAWEYSITALGAILQYFQDTQHHSLQQINTVQRIVNDSFLWMDRFTIRNLELMQPNVEGGKCLYDILNDTKTPMGARMLRQWLLFPLVDIIKIKERQSCVDLLTKDYDFLISFQKKLNTIGDLERLSSKIPLQKINPRELIQLKESLGIIQSLHTEALDKSMESSVLKHEDFRKKIAQLLPSEEIISLISATISEAAPPQLNKGYVIKEGYDEALDDLRNIAYKGKDFLLQMQLREQEITGISSLKIGFNNVFGYYLEVTNAHKDKVPKEWTRKQTLTNAERYITQELKEYEDKILGAEEKISSIELRLYQDLLEKLCAYIKTIQHNAMIIAEIDCMSSFASIAIKNQYQCPIINANSIINIKEGRHPVIEKSLPTGIPYIPNDVFLDTKDQQIIILTGPNMSGKSAVLRQVALITIMAHIGSFVPAASAHISLTDAVFTRVGASDNLSGGESTFMVEMNETASILNNITQRSLIILDEIGRGTSTYDGISIAWSIVEFLQRHAFKPFTMFATHYHELNEIAPLLPRVKNFHISHKETDQKVIFLRKLLPGGSQHSFGIQVARLAGMPKELTERADEILSSLEERRKDNHINKKLKDLPSRHYQLNIFDGIDDDLRQIKEILYGTDVNTMTPVEALLKINELKDIMRQYSV